MILNNFNNLNDSSELNNSNNNSNNNSSSSSSSPPPPPPPNNNNNNNNNNEGNRPNITNILREGQNNLTNLKLKRITNNLKWRQLNQNTLKYTLKLNNDKDILYFNQIDNGELRGIGTGAIVWPAAHVLVKYIEKRYSNPSSSSSTTTTTTTTTTSLETTTKKSLNNKRIIDIGSGTGFAGIACAALGGNVTLTDQLCVKDLIESNIELYKSNIENVQGNVIFQEYNWDETAEHLSPPFDIVLVSDCVLPKLYPIEPLIKAVSNVMNNNSIALFSYEHRIYPFFDPRHEFQRLAALYNLQVTTIPLSEHDPYYSSDDIEIWEVKRNLSNNSNIFQSDIPWPVNNVKGGISLQNWGENEKLIKINYSLPGENNLLSSSSNLLIIYQNGVRDINSQNNIPETLHENQVDENTNNFSDGIIGSYIWASSVVVSRFLIQHPTYSSLLSLLPSTFNKSSNINTNQTHQSNLIAYDIGAGCGLTSLILSICGYNVTTTDKPEILPLLRKNIETNQSLLNENTQISIKSFDWKKFQLLEESSNSIQNYFSEIPDLILLSDCFYQSDSVFPLWKVIQKISRQNTLLVIANELRSALDEFISLLRFPNKYYQENNDNIPQTSWNIHEIELFDEDLEIYRGKGGYLAVRPVKIYLCLPI